MRRSTRIDGSAGGEPLSCGTQSTYNRVANAGNLHRLSPFQMPFGILHNLTGKSSLTFSIEKCHFITAMCRGKCYQKVINSVSISKLIEVTVTHSFRNSCQKFFKALSYAGSDSAPERTAPNAVASRTQSG